MMVKRWSIQRDSRSNPHGYRLSGAVAYIAMADKQDLKHFRYLTALMISYPQRRKKTGLSLHAGMNRSMILFEPCDQTFHTALIRTDIRIFLQNTFIYFIKSEPADFGNLFFLQLQV